MTTFPPDLINGDTNYMYVEQFLQLGEPLPPESDGSISQLDVDQLAKYYNAEVDLVLAEIGMIFPLSPPDAKAIQWVRWTKTLAVAAYTLQGIAAQISGEAGDGRPEQFLEDYQNRLQNLIDTGGEFLDLDRNPERRPPLRVPAVPGLGSSEDILKMIIRRRLRFEQAVQVDRFENEEAIADFAPSEWLALIRGV